MGRKHCPQEYRERLIALARSGRSVASLAENFRKPATRNLATEINSTVKDLSESTSS